MKRNDDPPDFRDPSFVERLRARDSSAVEAVVHAYLPQILRAARGAGLGADRAEDVAQSVFLTFIESIARFEGRSHVRTWLFGILYRKISESWRTVRRERSTDDIDDVVESRFAPNGSWARPPRDTDRRALESEFRAHFDGCLEEVPGRQRMAFLLREVEGLTTAEIRNVMDVSDTNLGVLLYRARNRLRECLEGKGWKG